MNKNFRKKNNKGFSLLEILIAMTILAIIVVPLLHTFVTAAYTNNKAKKTLRATTAAQNMMEELKASRIEDVLRSIYGYTMDEDGKTVVHFNTNSFTVATGEAEGQTADIGAFEAAYSDPNRFTQVSSDKVSMVQSETGSSAMGRYVGSKLENSGYNLVFPCVSLDNAEYDMVVLLTPVTGKETKNVTINSMDRSDCVYFKQASDQAGLASDSFAASNETYRATHPNVEKDSTWFEETMTRDIFLDISQNNNGSITIGLKYAYEAPDNYTEDEDQVFTESETVVKDNASGRIPAIYVYYYPLYGNNTVRDNFIVTNKANLDTDIYFICMKDVELGYSQFNWENYQARLDITENEIGAENVGENRRESLHASFYSNVYDKFAGRIEDHNMYVNTTMHELGKETLENHLYDVEIRVFLHDSASFTLTDGQVTFVGKNTNLVTTFTGSLLDGSK